MKDTKMEIDEIKHIVQLWAKNEPLVKKIYIFGSRARNDYKTDSDLDIAIEVQKQENETEYSTWVYEKKDLKERLCRLLPFEVQLEHFEGNETPIIQSALKKSSILVYCNAEN